MMEIPVESALAISKFFREQGYTEENLDRLGLSELAWNSRTRRLASAWVVTGDARLDFLVRLFYLNEAATISESEKFIPKLTLRVLCAGGLLERKSERVRPACVLMHFGKLLLACDSRFRADACAADLVLGVNPTTQLLARCSMLRPGGEEAIRVKSQCSTEILPLSRGVE